MVIENHLYKCTNCETVKATNEDLGESTWLLICTSIRCQGMVTEHFRLDIIFDYSIAKGGKVYLLCRKEVMCDDSEKDNTTTVDVDRSEHK